MLSRASSSRCQEAAELPFRDERRDEATKACGNVGSAGNCCSTTRRPAISLTAGARAASPWRDQWW